MHHPLMLQIHHYHLFFWLSILLKIVVLTAILKKFLLLYASVPPNSQSILNNLSNNTFNYEDDAYADIYLY